MVCVVRRRILPVRFPVPFVFAPWVEAGVPLLIFGACRCCSEASSSVVSLRQIGVQNVVGLLCRVGFVLRFQLGRTRGGVECRLREICG